MHKLSLNLEITADCENYYVHSYTFPVMSQHLKYILKPSVASNNPSHKYCHKVESSFKSPNMSFKVKSIKLEN